MELAFAANRWLTQFEVELCHKRRRFHSCALICYVCCWCSRSAYPPMIGQIRHQYSSRSLPPALISVGHRVWQVEPNTVDSISVANLWTEECLEDVGWRHGKQHEISAREEKVWTEKNKHTFDLAHQKLCSFPFILLTFMLGGYKKKCTRKSSQSVSTIWPSQGSDVSRVRWAPRGTRYVFICDMWGCVCICVHVSERGRGKQKG